MNRYYVSKNVPLSENDARVLGILQAQGRRSYADLGTDLGMAGPSVHERVKKLEARGVIRGYAADVDPAAVGLPVLAFTWVTQAPGTVSMDLTPEFAAIPEIEECHYIAGEADYILKIRARDMEHLGAIVRAGSRRPSTSSRPRRTSCSARASRAARCRSRPKGGEAPETGRRGSA